MIPIEWLEELVRERDGYRRLLCESGSLTQAAYRLARAKCLTWEHSTSVPTRTEVRAAAREIARRVPGVSVPETTTLLRDCEALGLSVL
ncbi:MAG: hypothetical protein M5U28_45640 [Sandaracinaceae bacterium]|nr:hypothetical protein [Sandaracinaceae bacterium]